MLDRDQIEKLAGKSNHASPQKKADFNKKMKSKLKLWLREMPDMIKILNGLPLRVIENASLGDDLPNVIKFVDTFLEKVDPLPVELHESGELRNFDNAAIPKEKSQLPESLIKFINDEGYLIQSINFTASPAEIRVCNILRQHVESMQRYTDPAVVVIGKQQKRKLFGSDEQRSEMRRRSEMMGPTTWEGRNVKEKIPTKPPCKPRAMIDGKLHDFQIIEEQPT